MPIVYDRKTKKWELKIRPGDKEETLAVLEVGKRVIVGELMSGHTQAVYKKWLDMPSELMWGPE